MIELYHEYLSVWCIWLYVIIMWHTRFRVNPSDLNVKELLARSRREILSLSECNWTRTHNHFVRKPTHNHLAKLTKWLSCVVSTDLYGGFGCFIIMSRTRFRVNPDSIVAWMSWNSLLEADAETSDV